MRTCEVCNVECEDETHKSSDIHRFNYVLYQWSNYRKGLVKDRNGIEVSHVVKTEELQSKICPFEKNRGKFTITVSAREFQSVNHKLWFGITVKNDRNKDAMYIMNAGILAPFRAFSLEGPSREGDVIILQSKQQCDYNVYFNLNAPLPGSYKIPIYFTFQSPEDNKLSFSIARQIVVVISDLNPEKEDNTKSPFKFTLWENIHLIVACVNHTYVTNNYPIPKKYHKILMAGLSDRHLNYNERLLLNYIKNCICPGYTENGDFESRYPTETNYKDFFHFLLWLDEIGQVLMLQRYNMSNVRMKVVPGDMLELEVPGLAEKRPSLISGDIVKIRFHGDHTVYKGIVKTINDKSILIYGMHDELLNAIIDDERTELDVAFELGRLSYERMHRAVDVCVDKGLLGLLFPSIQLANRRFPNQYNIPDARFFNRNILGNNEQKTAVVNILNGTSLAAPYIVFGPPGTGKTLTIVEAILQIKQHLAKSKILVCAPANAACDMLTTKLMPHLTTKELIRVHTGSRNWNDVPTNIKEYSNHNEREYLKIVPATLSSYRVVVTTLCLIGKYSGQYNPDYVFIDEAAQAMEPEADIAVSMLQLGTHLILAGDPKQLGPQCASIVAAKHKLENSLLQRLMDTNSLYQHGDARFITMLKLNYRAHPLVLAVPNKLFYDDQLRTVNIQAQNDPIAKIFIHPLAVGKMATKNVGLPIEFCGVNAKERRQGKSPSYFNLSELQMVINYVKAMLSLPDIKVEQSEIGVVTPYIRQVHQIKNYLRTQGCTDIEVGTTEVFQGREKRIIIISTVRAQHDLLLVDKQYRLGFVKNEKRMNVALTRAMSKLIIIGHPHVLGTCPNWEYYIQFCEEHGAYFGAQYLRRTPEVQRTIAQRLGGVKMSNF